MRNLTTFLVFTLFALVGFGQTWKEFVRFGDESMDAQDYYAASEFYRKAMLQDSAIFELNVKFAESLRLSKDYARAAYYYEKAFKKDKGKLFEPGQYYLASMQKINGAYKKALRNLKRYSTKKYGRSPEDSVAKSPEYIKLQQEISSLNFAIAARSDSSKYLIRHFEEPLNTVDSELSVWQNMDSSLYISSSDALGNVHLYSTFQLPDSTFETRSLLAEPFNVDDAQSANFTLNKTGTKAVFSQCRNGKCDLLMLERDSNGGDWGEPFYLKTLNSDSASTTMPHFATMEGYDYLVFASNRSDSKGGYDLYRARITADGVEYPKNLGSRINSPGNELSPFVIGENIYFSSDWHDGFGGYDVFLSELKRHGWAPPKNMGRPINSNYNDLYFSYFTHTKTGFLSSNRSGSLTEGRSTCCSDLYIFQFADSLENKIDNPYKDLKELNDYLPVTLYFHNDEPNPNTRDSTTTLSYLDAYDSYNALKLEYFVENSKGLAGTEAEEAIFDVEDFYAFKVNRGRNDLRFFTELLLEELEKGRRIELQIKGFASPLAESDYNVILTKRRISSLVNYLKRYENGAFLTYFAKDKLGRSALQIEEIPFGEDRAQSGVSDELSDQKGSIYSRAARLERKIEILSVNLAGVPKEGVACFTEDFHDFGTIPENRKLEHTFSLVNEGGADLKIVSIEAACGCTIPELEKYIIRPGETAKLKIIFDPKGQVGDVKKNVSITLEDGSVEVLWFFGEVVD